MKNTIFHKIICVFMAALLFCSPIAAIAVEVPNETTKVTAPVIGEHPTFASSNDDITVTSQFWKNETDNEEMTAEDVFEANKEYSYNVRITKDDPDYDTSEIFDMESDYLIGQGSAGSEDEAIRMSWMYYTGEVVAKAPVIGEHPTYVRKAFPGTVTSQFWRNETDNEEMTAEDVFEANKEYSYNVRITKDDPDYDTSEIFNMESEYLVGKGSAVSDGGAIRMSWMYYTGEVVAKAPVIGEHPTYARNQINASIISQTWYNRTDDKEMTEADVFEANKEYEYNIDYIKHSGELPVAMESEYLIIHGSAMVNEETGVNRSGWVYYTGETVAKAPVIGEHPIYARKSFNGSVIEQGWYNITDDKDMTEADVFEANKEYEFYIVYIKNGGELPVAMESEYLTGAGGAMLDEETGKQVFSWEFYTGKKPLPFKDVNESDWYYETVKFVSENGIIRGYNPTTFAPNDNITRGQLVTILWRLEGEPSASEFTNKFIDVGEDYYTEAVKWAAENKIVNGYGGTAKFGPNDLIIRQDLAVILNNYAKYKELESGTEADLSVFGDYNLVKGNYSEPALKWAVGNGVMNGKNVGKPKKEIQGGAHATRAEAAAMVMNFIKAFDLL